MKKMTEEEKKESLECSRINFYNLEKSMPNIKKHPFYHLAKIQLDHGLGYQNDDYDKAEKELGLE